MVITRKTTEPPQLFTRTFKVHPNTFIKNLGIVLDRQNVETNLTIGSDFLRSPVSICPRLVLAAADSAAASVSQQHLFECSNGHSQSLFFNDRTEFCARRRWKSSIYGAVVAGLELDSAADNDGHQVRRNLEADARALGFD